MFNLFACVICVEGGHLGMFITRSRGGIWISCAVDGVNLVRFTSSYVGSVFSLKPKENSSRFPRAPHNQISNQVNILFNNSLLKEPIPWLCNSSDTTKFLWDFNLVLQLFVVFQRKYVVAEQTCVIASHNCLSSMTNRPA